MVALATAFVGLVLWGTQQGGSEGPLAQEGLKGRSGNVRAGANGAGDGNVAATGVPATNQNGAPHHQGNGPQTPKEGPGKESTPVSPPTQASANVLEFDPQTSRQLPLQDKASSPGFARAPSSACSSWARSNEAPTDQHSQNIPKLFKSNLDMPGTPYAYVKHGERTAFLTQASAEKGKAAPGANIGALAGDGGVTPAEAAHQKCPKGVQMDDGEIAAMHKWMAEGAAAHGHSHLTSMHMEWGTGGSTLLNGLRAGHIFAVEHHPEWCALISRCFESLGWNHITAVCAPADLQQHDWCPPSHSNTGLSEGGMGAFHTYVNAPLSVIPLPGQPAPVLDSILVDGRARIACALRAYAFMDMDTALMIHDSNREYYTRHLAPYFNFNKARDCTLPSRGICRLYPKKEFVGRVLPEDFIAKVADLYNDRTWQPVPPPPVESMPLLSELLAA